ncbi:MAG: hypothetical protein KGY80_12795 [Candidatus Thorarchaeota archaeon]|nr:hypothetical protein [Candidatus Thorarchaeota archaeon]
MGWAPKCTKADSVEHASDNSGCLTRTPNVLLPPMQVLMVISLPVIVLAIVSTVVSIIVLLYALLLVNNSNSTEEILDSQIRTATGKLFATVNQSDDGGYHRNWLASSTYDWKLEDFDDFLDRIMTHEELTVFKTMVDFLLKDNVVVNPKTGSLPQNDSEAGFRNKHRISQASGISQNVIYNPDGMIERFLNIGIIEEREPSSGWGGQKEVYRLNLQHGLVRAYLNCLFSSR